MNHSMIKGLLLLSLMLLSGCGTQQARDVETVAQHEKERGLGGTGVLASERGLGGTGIIGTITAFGSVWVNGLHVHYKQDTVIERNGSVVSAEQLAIGQSVVATAFEDQDGRLVATQLGIVDQVIGPVQQIDIENGSLSILDQQIDTSALTKPLAEIQLGEWLAVSGVIDEGGVIRANYLEPTSSDQTALLRGTPYLDTQQRLKIGGQTLNLESNEPTILGKPVLVKGHYANGLLNISELQIENSTPFEADISRISIETRVMRSPSGEVRLHSAYPLELPQHRVPPMHDQSRLYLELRPNMEGEFRLERMDIGEPRPAPRMDSRPQQRSPIESIAPEPQQRPELRRAEPVKPEHHQFDRPDIRRPEPTPRPRPLRLYPPR